MAAHTCVRWGGREARSTHVLRIVLKNLTMLEENALLGSYLIFGLGWPRAALSLTAATLRLLLTDYAIGVCGIFMAQI